MLDFDYNIVIYEFIIRSQELLIRTHCLGNNNRCQGGLYGSEIRGLAPAKKI